MEPIKTVSKTRIILMWMMMVSFILSMTIFCFWSAHKTVAPAPESEAGTLAGNPIVSAIFYLAAGAFFLVLGLTGYFVVLLTTCFTFNFSSPVWNALKVRQYMVNIAVLLGISLGLGFMAMGFLALLLDRSGGNTNFLPMMIVLVLVQLSQLWILIWNPVERGMILKRLAALGVMPEHLKGAMLVGISNPASGAAKRFASIEEDMGALWVTPDRLAWRGDVEQFDLTRDLVVQIERKADNRSITVLAGIAHPILHVRMPDGSIRQMRLHVEGFWTMGQKRKAMDTLANSLDSWYAGGAAG